MEQAASVQLVQDNQDKLQLSGKQFKKWAGKRYIVLIEVDQFEQIEAFKIDKTNFSNMDDWLPVGNIEDVRIK